MNKAANSPERKKRVVVVDDHPMLRDRLALLINQELDMETCGEAEDTKSALELIQRTSPDLAIVDLTLRGSSGIELVMQMRALSLSIPILILSMHEETLYAERVLRAGANGYITKHEAAEEIATAIRRVLAGDVYLSQKMVSGVLKGLIVSGGKSQRQPLECLGNRELEVFTLIGRGHSAEEIAKLLEIGPATFRTYRRRIRMKLGIQSASELQHFATKWVYDNDRS